jgi:hypothetical protein
MKNIKIKNIKNYLWLYIGIKYPLKIHDNVKFCTNKQNLTTKV